MGTISAPEGENTSIKIPLSLWGGVSSEISIALEAGITHMMIGRLNEQRDVLTIGETSEHRGNGRCW